MSSSTGNLIGTQADMGTELWARFEGRAFDVTGFPQHVDRVTLSNYIWGLTESARLYWFDPTPRARVQAAIQGGGRAADHGGTVFIVVPDPAEAERLIHWINNTLRTGAHEDEYVGNLSARLALPWSVLRDHLPSLRPNRHRPFPTRLSDIPPTPYSRLELGEPPRYSRRPRPFPLPLSQTSIGALIRQERNNRREHPWSAPDLHPLSIRRGLRGEMILFRHISDRTGRRLRPRRPSPPPAYQSEREGSLSSLSLPDADLG